MKNDNLMMNQKFHTAYVTHQSMNRQMNKWMNFNFLENVTFQFWKQHANEWSWNNSSSFLNAKSEQTLTSKISHHVQLFPPTTFSWQRRYNRVEQYLKTSTVPRDRNQQLLNFLQQLENNQFDRWRRSVPNSCFQNKKVIDDDNLAGLKKL